MGPRVSWMIPRVDSGYRRVSRAEAWRLVRADRMRLDGMDCDEEENTVTYWFRRTIPGYDV